MQDRWLERRKEQAELELGDRYRELEVASKHLCDLASDFNAKLSEVEFRFDLASMSLPRVMVMPLTMPLSNFVPLKGVADAED